MLPQTTPAAAALARFLSDWPAAPSQPVRRPDISARAASHSPAPPAHAPHGAAPPTTASQGAAPHAPPQQPFPVLRWLPRLTADADCFGADFIQTLRAAAGSLAWRQTYAVAEVGEEFLRNYAWAEIAAGHDARIGTVQISCGVLVLGPDTFYPPHRHEAEEIYLPLAGTAEWRKGDGAWRRHPPGTSIHHSSEETHAMRTGDQPLLAMYLWRSETPGQSARLDAGSAE